MLSLLINSRGSYSCKQNGLSLSKQRQHGGNMISKLRRFSIQVLNTQQQGFLQPTASIVEYRDDQSWMQPLKSKNAIVALGKFDALHIGHRSLVEEASLMGDPYLISFSGMAQILNWPPRLPLVAKCDRPRVLRSWKKFCNDKIPMQKYIPFELIRNMNPEEFVQYLVRGLGVKGVVTGENYRFGYKAAGDVELLQKFGKQYGFVVKTVTLLTDGNQQLVSSSNVRNALFHGDVLTVEKSLDRKYRLVVPIQITDQKQDRVFVIDTFSNQPIFDGKFIVRYDLCSAEQEVQFVDFNEQKKLQVQFQRGQLWFDNESLVNNSSNGLLVIEFDQYL
eukprot:TRINITY_DN1551_c1_g1_i1.p1 TRINITY_DN1551_c1_g1~~TRINITY_DN1551_c1_g1_i1.p1  ORF type:complete len:334 (-),score=21.30 TRINITY_DN1551_c1_g1_i1:75-1076(-)